MNRILEKKLKELFGKFPIVFLTGPRQSGKTTLTKMVFPGLSYVNFEDISLLNLVKEDPHGFLKQYNDGVIIDEVQHFPEIFSYIQLYADQMEVPGQYILTGSQNFLMNEKISQTLAGRVGVLNLLPLSYNEILQEYDISTDDAILQGGYPRLYKYGIDTSDFFAGYLQTYIEQDVRQIKNISSLSSFQKFLLLCAGRVGQILNLSSLSSDCGMSVPTLKEWLSILEASYVIYLISPLKININKQMVKSPKLYFYDTGVLCNLLRIKDKEELKQHFAYGNIFENFVINEIVKHQFNLGERRNVCFLRDAKGNEVDCVVPKASGKTLYEIKSSATFNGDFIKGINYYMKSEDEGEVIYQGDKSFTYKDIKVVSLEKFLCAPYK